MGESFKEHYVDAEQNCGDYQEADEAHGSPDPWRDGKGFEYASRAICQEYDEGNGGCVAYEPVKGEEQYVDQKRQCTQEYACRQQFGYVEPADAFAPVDKPHCQNYGRQHAQGEHAGTELVEAHQIHVVVYRVFGIEPRVEQDGIDAECQQKQEWGGVAHAPSGGIVGYYHPRMYEQFAAGVQEAPFEAEHVGKR